MVGLEVSGHAGFAEAGRDIVCAAVSALVFSAAEGLRAYCKVKTSVEDAATAYKLRVPAGGDERAQAVLETAVSGLHAIAVSYPRHLLVEEIVSRRKRGAGTGQASPQRNSAVRAH